MIKQFDHRVVHSAESILATWLLDQFPLEPLPIMLEPFTATELEGFRRAFQERLRRIALLPPS